MNMHIMVYDNPFIWANRVLPKLPVCDDKSVQVDGKQIIEFLDGYATPTSM